MIYSYVLGTKHTSHRNQATIAITPSNAAPRRQRAQHVADLQAQLRELTPDLREERMF